MFSSIRVYFFRYTVSPWISLGIQIGDFLKISADSGRKFVSRGDICINVFTVNFWVFSQVQWSSSVHASSPLSPRGGWDENTVNHPGPDEGNIGVCWRFSAIFWVSLPQGSNKVRYHGTHVMGTSVLCQWTLSLKFGLQQAGWDAATLPLVQNGVHNSTLALSCDGGSLWGGACDPLGPRSGTWKPHNRRKL